MKQLLSFLAGSAITALVMYYYGPTKKSSSTESNVTTQNVAPANKEFSFFAGADKKSDTVVNLGIADMLISEQEGNDYIRNYIKDHDTSKAEVTASYFFGRNAISYMGYYFDTADKSVAGVRIYNIQYNKMMPNVPGQRSAKSPAIIFVPQRFDGVILWNEWTKATVSPFSFFDGLNHGELCPNRCP